MTYDPQTHATTSVQLERFTACVFDPDDIIEVRRLPSTKSTWHRAGELAEQAAAFGADNDGGEGIHIGANPRLKAGGTTACGVRLARCLFADFDDCNADDARSAWQAAKLPRPTLTMMSGHGVHVYWRLHEPLHDLNSWTNWQRDLAATLGSDGSVKDPPRLMRLPGFMNHKAPAAQAELIDADATRVFELAELAVHIPKRPETVHAACRTTDDTRKFIGQSLDVIARAAKYLDTVDPAIEGQGGDAATYRTACMLINDFGLTPNEAMPLFQSWNGRCEPRWSEKDLRDKLEHAVKYATKPIGNLANVPMSIGRPTMTGGVKPEPANKPPDWWTIGTDEGIESLPEPFEPFPVEALPPAIARFVQTVAGATGTDPAWAALAALVVMAGCIGNRVAVILKKGWVEPAILWAALVGKSGSIKSVALRHVTRPLLELFKNERDAFVEKTLEYDKTMERYSVDLSKWKSDQKNGPPTDPPLEPEKPCERRLLVSDVTIEKLAALLGENPLGLLVVRDELAGLVNSFDRYAGGKGSDLQSWLSMNDGGSLLVDRKSDGSTFVERASVSLLGTIQPFTLRNVFGIAEREAGFLARILLAFPPDRPSLWSEDELPDQVVSDWQNLLAALLELQPIWDDADRPQPRLIPMSGEAKRAFIEWHDRHARQMEELVDDYLRAHWSKLKGMCARIALLFSCAEAACGVRVSLVSLDSIQRAFEVTEWLKKESARIYLHLRESDSVRERRKLMEWIEQRRGSVTVRDLTHNFTAFRGDTDGARAALDELVKSELGRWYYPRPGTEGGRPSEKFILSSRGVTPKPKPPLETT